MNRLRKLITSADQLVDGKQYELVQGKITIKTTFSEVVHPEPHPGYCTTDEKWLFWYDHKPGEAAPFHRDRSEDL